MAERQSRIRLACAQMALISLISVTPMATSSSGLLGKLPDFIAEPKLRRAVLSGRFFRSGGRRRPPASTRVHQPFKNRYAAPLGRVRRCRALTDRVVDVTPTLDGFDVAVHRVEV